MNIIIPDSWLKDYLETEASPVKIAEILSQTAASVEKIEKKDGDYLYYIEITTNRIDMYSIFGLAKELAAILPFYGVKARLKKTLPKTKKIKTYPKVDYLNVKIQNSFLCPRFAAVLFTIENLKKTPEYIVERLNKVGVRSLNPIIDITNYLMFELGQPMHVFDYEKIKEQTMILRESKNGEEIVTLDGNKRTLPEGAIVIEDGKKRLIDLCGIMGAENSCVDQNTKKVLLFVQSYNPARIRKTAQILSFRTEAATRFEKGIDSELVLPALEKAMFLYQKILPVKKIYPILDIYPKKIIAKKINLLLTKVNNLIGVNIPKKTVISILSSLGFLIKDNGDSLFVTVPSYRVNDVSLPEDLIEEIARVYGLHRLPSIIPKTDFLIDEGFKKLEIEKEIKKALCFWGFTETYSYSMIGKKDLENAGISEEEVLKIANPLTVDCVYMRSTLIPSLLNLVLENKNFEEIKLFEIARVYQKKKGILPDEPRFLSAVSNTDDFYSLKGTLEALFLKIGAKDINFKLLEKESSLWQIGETAEITTEKEVLGYLGVVNRNLREKLGIEKEITAFELNLEDLIKNLKPIKIYQPPLPYPAIIEDLAFIFPKEALVGETLSEIYKTSPLIAKVEFLDAFDNTRTFRIYFQSKERNLTDKEVKELREKIIKRLKEKFNIRLKEKERLPKIPRW